MKTRCLAALLLLSILLSFSACDKIMDVGSLFSSTDPTESQTEVMIAPLLDAASIEPTYDLESMDSVYVPELGAATGFRLYTEYIPSEGFPYYKLASGMSIEETVAALDEYVALLDSLPYFDVIDAPHLKVSDTVYLGALKYTGEGRVISEEESLYCSEPFAFAFYFDKNDKDILTRYGDGLKIVDTGHRLSCTEYTAQQVYGPHIADAFYMCGDTYYSSDKALSAKSGECSIILNGEHYIGSTEGSGQAKFYAKDYHRADWIEIYLEKNYPMDEDLYTRADLLQYKTSSITTTTKGDRVVLSVSSNNGADYEQPRPRQNDNFEGLSVRVLQWEPEGDVVLYFYADLYLDNDPYEIEGLLVADLHPTEESTEEQSDGDKVNGASDRERTCSSCTGSGRCGSCSGRGYRTQWIAQKQEQMPCASCATSGRCSYCGGDGKR